MWSEIMHARLPWELLIFTLSNSNQAKKRCFETLNKLIAIKKMLKLPKIKRFITFNTIFWRRCLSRAILMLEFVMCEIFSFENNVALLQLKKHHFQFFSFGGSYALLLNFYFLLTYSKTSAPFKKSLWFLKNFVD